MRYMLSLTHTQEYHAHICACACAGARKRLVTDFYERQHSAAVVADAHAGKWKISEPRCLQTHIHTFHKCEDFNTSHNFCVTSSNAPPLSSSPLPLLRPPQPQACRRNGVKASATQQRHSEGRMAGS